MTAAIGFDEAGSMDGLALGWVVMATQGHTLLIVQQSGGGGPRPAERKKPVIASQGGASEPPNTLLRGKTGARPRSGEPSQPLSAGSTIRRRFLDRGSSATHQQSCGFDPRIRV
jgi:hypothetical protein